MQDGILHMFDDSNFSRKQGLIVRNNQKRAANEKAQKNFQIFKIGKIKKEECGRVQIQR